MIRNRTQSNVKRRKFCGVNTVWIDQSCRDSCDHCCQQKRQENCIGVSQFIDKKSACKRCVGASCNKCAHSHQNSMSGGDIRQRRHQNRQCAVCRTKNRANDKSRRKESTRTTRTKRECCGDRFENHKQSKRTKEHQRTGFGSDWFAQQTLDQLISIAIKWRQFPCICCDGRHR